jgi:hypothetical protein
MAYEGLKGNKNAEKWTLEDSIALFEESIELLNEKESVKINGNSFDAYKYDFIGEIAKELKTFKEIFSHLLKRFPEELKDYHKLLITNVEQNCYHNTKKGAIREATGIVNLKSNHKWTDRLDQTTQDQPLNEIDLTVKDIEKIIDKL